MYNAIWIHLTEKQVTKLKYLYVRICEKYIRWYLRKNMKIWFRVLIEEGKERKRKRITNHA